MQPLLAAALYSLFAGAMIPAGAILARFEHIRPQWLEHEFRHSVMAFGGGVLIAATALVLIPHGVEHLSVIPALAAFAVGGSVFALLEARGGGTGRHAQFWAMLSDFVPEALALGALIAADEPAAGLLALLIGLQNLPEGFNAWREEAEARDGGAKPLLWRYGAIAFLGPVLGMSGYFLLAGHSEITATIMMVAAGGILFLMFQDIAPKAHLENRIAPSVAAVAGFGVALLGQMLIG